MYTFIAYYVHMDTDEVRAKLVEVDGQFFENEKSIYTHAMGKAYDLKQNRECFSHLLFVSC